jgi:hypothetical protein
MNKDSDLTDGNSSGNSIKKGDGLSLAIFTASRDINKTKTLKFSPWIFDGYLIKPSCRGKQWIFST